MKPIMLTEEIVNEMRAQMIKELEEKFNLDTLTAEADKSLKKAKMTDGEFKFKKEFKFEKKFSAKADDKRRAIIRITPDAFSKMSVVIMSQSKEVAWHGISERISDQEFLIKDILVYPQKVTAVTVDTDEEEYAKWLIEIGEDNFNNLHFHGHSHVDMGVTPSSTDLGHRREITAQLGKDDYYIFMIWNKKLNWSASIYDMPTNTMYETDDIDVIVSFADGTTAGGVVLDLDKKVKNDKPAATKYPIYNSKEWWNDSKKEKGEVVTGNSHDSFRGNYGYYGYSGYAYEW